ncbi:MAG TPA: thioredoxin domain-containing protein [Candidatus Acidoferrum sp.]|nr:thioredoxin domain-containing protein [Candidatus Acidoferrum sp.]
MKPFCLLGISFFLTVTAPNSLAQTASLSPDAKNAKTEKPLATVEGQAITETDLAPYVAGQLRPLKEQEYEIKKKALDILIGQRVLEAEAKKRNVSTEKLLQQEADAKVPEPTDVEVGAIYAVQKEQFNKPLEEVKGQIQQTLKRARVQQARQEYSTRLREGTKVSILLAPPRTEVSFDPARVRGNPKAEVIIVEFSDFQCPYCGQVQGALRNVLAKYPATVALAFRDLPVPQIHPMAIGAAQAGRCAGEQGKFWELHDLMFADQSNLDRDGLLKKAQTLQLNQKEFSLCLSSEKYKEQIQQDGQEGMRAGVTGTPGFFINGIFMSGALPEAAFLKVIEEQLAIRAKSD